MGGDPIEFASVPLTVGAADTTFLTDDPDVSQYAQHTLQRNDPLTGLARYNDYYLFAACQDEEGQTIYGFVPMKDVQPKEDLAMPDAWRASCGYGDTCWQVMDALTGKWNPAGGADWGRLILYVGGRFTTNMPWDGVENFCTKGKVRITGQAPMYCMHFFTEDGQEESCDLTLNVDGTITLIQDGHETVLVRDEASTFGNG